MAGEGGMGGDQAPGGAGSPSNDGGQGGSGDVSCSGKTLTWKAQPSNVMVLMDRSGSMFDVDSKPWVPVRDALLPVIDTQDTAENLGFIAMSAEAGSCPLLDEVAPTAGNYGAHCQQVQLAHQADQG